MARTKASAGFKVMSGKSSSSKSKGASAQATPSTSSSSSSHKKSSSKSKEGGGNPYCPRETPDWQKTITSFFAGAGPSSLPDKDVNTHESEDEEVASTRRKKPNLIISDDEDDCPNPDDSLVLDLPPPSPDDTCHKIAEYFDPVVTNSKKTFKGKGEGKKSSDSDSRKENLEPSTDDEKTLLTEKGNKRVADEATDLPAKKVKLKDIVNHQ